MLGISDCKSWSIRAAGLDDPDGLHLRRNRRKRASAYKMAILQSRPFATLVGAFIGLNWTSVSGMRCLTTPGTSARNCLTTFAFPPDTIFDTI
jgi:hypothetical protein